MNGFESMTTTTQPTVPPQAASGADQFGASLSREEIDRHIARGHQLRARELQQWGQRIARTWGSLFRRRGRLIPDSMRPIGPMPTSLWALGGRER